MKNQVLDHKKIIRICNRLAYQIIENSENKKSIILVGIKEKGYEVSKLITQELTKICSNKIIFVVQIITPILIQIIIITKI